VVAPGGGDLIEKKPAILVGIPMASGTPLLEGVFQRKGTSYSCGNSFTEPGKAFSSKLPATHMIIPWLLTANGPGRDFLS
jgi:hypothetical protein